MTHITVVCLQCDNIPENISKDKNGKIPCVCVFRYGKVCNRILARQKNKAPQRGVLFLCCGGWMRTPRGSTMSRFCKRSAAKSSGMPRRHYVPRESHACARKINHPLSGCLFLCCGGCMRTPLDKAA